MDQVSIVDDLVYTDPMIKNILVIFNPTAGRRRGERVKKSDPAITEAHATELLRRDVNIAYRSVARLTAPYTEDLTDNQMGALTSLCFNIGSGNFRASSVRSNIVRGEIENAGKNFWQWRRANSRIVSGLVKRRARETQLYFS